MFTQQLLLHTSNEWFSKRERKSLSYKQSNLCEQNTEEQHSLRALVEICDDAVRLLLQPFVDVMEVFWYLNNVDNTTNDDIFMTYKSRKVIAFSVLFYFSFYFLFFKSSISLPNINQEQRDSHKTENDNQPRTHN